MSLHRIYADSLEHVRVPVVATLHGLPYDPTGDTVQMAFVLLDQTEPADGDWYDASWDTLVPGTASESYVALCLVGAGGTVELAPGIYQVFVKVTDNPEIPVKPASNLLKIV